MEARHHDRTDGRRELGQSVLHGAELALKHKLRRRFSADFISRHADDLIAQAAMEYASAVGRGIQIRNPGGFLVDVAYKRALDALDRESRISPATELDAVVSLADPNAPHPLEELSREEERSHLYEAISRLDLEERKVISLVYFEGMSGREAAGPLGCSESTALRRLRSASQKLRKSLPAIEAGEYCAQAAPQLRAVSEGTADRLQRTQASLHLRNCASCRQALARREAFGFEVGLAAWLSIAAHNVHPEHVLDPAVAALDSAREGLGGTIERCRDFLARLFSSGGGESLGNLAGGPLGKAAGVCATAAAACVLTGVVGPGIGGIDEGGRDAAAGRPSAVRASPSSHAVVQDRSSESVPMSSSAGSSTPGSSGSHKQRRAPGAPQGLGSAPQQSPAERSAGSQFGVESLSEGSSSGAATSLSTKPAGQTPDAVASQQFGIP